MARAMDVVDMIDDPMLKILSLRGLAEALSPNDMKSATEATELAVLVANTIDEGEHHMRSQALAHIVPAIAQLDPDNAEVVSRASDVAVTIGKLKWRSVAFARAAAAVSSSTDGSPAIWVEQALTIAFSESDPKWRDLAIAGVIEEVSKSDLSLLGATAEAMELADSITDSYLHDRAIADIAEATAATGPKDRDRINSAIALTKSMTNPAFRRTMMERLASRALEPNVGFGYNDILDVSSNIALTKTLNLADEIERDHDRNIARLKIVSALVDDQDAPDRITQAIDVASSIGDHGIRSSALTKIAMSRRTHHVAESEALIAESVDAASKIEDPFERCLYLGSIAQHVSAQDPTEARRILGLAKQAVSDISYSDEKSRAISGIAPILANLGDAESIAEATHLCSTITDGRERDSTFRQIVEAIATD